MRKITFLVIATILFGMSSFISQSEAKPLRSQKAVQSGIDMTYPVYIDGALVHNNQDGSESTPTKTNKKQKKRNKGEYLIASPAGEEGSGRPADCPGAWCGCWLSKQIFGENRRDLWVAKNWLKFPRTAPQIGSVAVMSRRGGGHVGVVVSFDERGNPILKSGNHNRRVATAVYPKSRIIAYVSP
jgi:hypothetical protein